MCHTTSSGFLKKVTLTGISALICGCNGYLKKFKMKVLFVSSGNIKGRIGTVVENQAKSLEASGVEILYFSGVCSA